MRRLGLSALCLLMFACSSKPEVPPPMVNGSYLTYSVREEGDSQATLRFTTTDDGFKLSMQANGGTRDIMLNAEARAEEGKIELPLKGGAIDLGLLWLTPRERKSGARTKAGRVNKRQNYKQWQVWEVLRTAPEATLYYEVNTGMLVGWKMSRGTLDIGGYLVDSQ